MCDKGKQHFQFQLYLLLLPLLVLFYSCTVPPKVQQRNQFSPLFTCEASYLKSYDNQGKMLSNYEIKSQLLPEKVICLSTTYLAYFEALNALNKVIACVDLDRIPQRFPNITNLHSAQLDLEKIMSLQPDLIIANSYQLKEIEFLKGRYPVLIVNEFWETHPLGKTEWIKFFGALCGKQKQADSIFTESCKKYQEESKKNKSPQKQVSNVSKYAQNYFLPGCESLLAQYFKDLSISFPCEGNHSESVEIPEEKALSILNQSKYLLFFDWHQNNRTHKDVMQELGVNNFKQPIIYCNTFGSNYFQKSILHPDEILHDLHFCLKDSSFKGKYFSILNP